MIHPTADISSTAVIGAGTRVWHRTQICDGALVGDDCIIGSGVYIDRGVVVGSRVKIQTGAQLYHGAVVEDGVFVGPLVCLTNDKHPRAITPHGQLQTDSDWEVGETRVHYGASLGTGAIVLPGVTVGVFAMVGAGAVVVDDVPDHGLVLGCPARLVGYVCSCGRRLEGGDAAETERFTCRTCSVEYRLEPGGKGLCRATAYEDALTHKTEEQGTADWREASPPEHLQAARTLYAELCHFIDQRRKERS